MRLRQTRKGFNKAGAKGLLVAVVLAFFTLLAVVKLAPYIWDEVQAENLSDIPGGSLFKGFIFFMVMFLTGIAIILKVLDVI